MIIVSGYTSAKRATNMPQAYKITTPSILTASIIVLSVLAITRAMPLEPQFIVPLSGMVFGNSILFGVFTTLSRIFSEQSALETIKKFVPSETINQNLEAFELGKQEAEKFLKQSKGEKN